MYDDRADKKYSTSNDGRIVTGAWVESCIYANAVVEPGKRLLDRPFAFKVPFESTSPFLRLGHRLESQADWDSARTKEGKISMLTFLDLIDLRRFILIDSFGVWVRPFRFPELAAIHD